MRNYLKRAKPSSEGEDRKTREAVAGLIEQIRAGGEDATREAMRRFDDWNGDIVVDASARAAAAEKIDLQTRDDILFARAAVQKFAEAQRAGFVECEIEIAPGVVAGHRNIAVQVAGCYAPGGRYAHVASAVMSVATAKTAGVDFVVACSPPRQENGGIHPAVLYALDICGADAILNLGGVQAICAMAFGLFTGRRADILVGPGNQYVAEAKRALFGEVGIDMFAGPTEILVIADKSADPEIVAADLIGQAEHGPNSPAWLVSLDEGIANEVARLAPTLAQSLPSPNRDHALAAWQDCGEIVIAKTREEAADIADEYAPEHLQVHCAGLDWWRDSLRNYGALFLGEETTVAYGDKASGPNHILPTRGAARYTGGLSVGKFLKTVTWQRMTREANFALGPVCARLSRLEGMEGHARTADARLKKYAD